MRQGQGPEAMLVYRPSKIRFYCLFKRMIKKAEPFISILDFASAGAKNISFFRGKLYHGADINAQLQKQAREKYKNDRKARLFTASLLKPGLTGRYDLVVSTHTLAHVHQKKRAVINLYRLVKWNGNLILQLEKRFLTKGILDILDQAFICIKVFDYRGMISVMYENFLMRLLKTDNLGGIKTTGLFSKLLNYLFLTLSFAFSFLDFIGKKHCSLILCKGKRKRQ
jgi:SAM-dependent methyltransferase